MYVDVFFPKIILTPRFGVGQRANILNLVELAKDCNISSLSIHSDIGIKDHCELADWRYSNLE